MNTIVSRIAALRNEMLKLNLSAIYISGTDPHSSEYLPERWRTREFISGFTGSYGIVVVTRNEAALWTDSRYFIQAEEQLDGSGIELQKHRIPGAVTPDEWLAKKLKAGEKVGVDAQTISVIDFRNLKNNLLKNKIELIVVPDILNSIWEQRPGYPRNPVFELSIENVGLSTGEKQNRINKYLVHQNADLHLVTMLDELAWLFNLRGSDIDYNPVFIGFGLVGQDKKVLFLHPNKISNDLKSVLINSGVEIEDYENFYSYLKKLKGHTIYLDPKTCNFKIYNSLFQHNKLIEGQSVISGLKAQKNKTEIAGFKKAMLNDGLALVGFLHWLKTNIGKTKISEYDVGVKLREFRQKQPGFVSESFPPIVGYKQHGAIVHLSVGPENALDLEAGDILLFDSGGQYLTGTTDITRTVALGQPSATQKKHFTLVLKGMIALSMAKFPAGTKGCNLDVLARNALWQAGLNYGHGTGHGVGHFLNVHEGPMSVRQEYNENAIQPGHVLSNEPGFYLENEYGIRIENLMVCIEHDENEFGRFFAFETLTLCPIDINLIELELLDKSERAWLNNYHKMIRGQLTPHLDKKYHEFLNELTQAL